MSRDKLRRLITSEAARLIATGRETDMFRARRAASRRLCRGWLRPAELPSDAEIRDEIERCAYLYEGDARFDNLRELRLAALTLMQLFAPLHPRLLGDVFTGGVRRAGSIHLQLFADDIAGVRRTLDSAGIICEGGAGRLSPRGTSRTRLTTAIDDIAVVLDCYAADRARTAFVTVATGDRVPRATLSQLSALIDHEYPDLRHASATETVSSADRFQVYRMLLLPLADVDQPRQTHPEGDALYHSLQVFELVRADQPWDEELLLAALLHDVGKGIDPLEHTAAGLAALDGLITDRTAWLIDQHLAARKLLDGALGARAKRRLQQHEDYDSLLVLARADRAGRVPGATVPTLDETLAYIRELAHLCG